MSLEGDNQGNLLWLARVAWTGDDATGGPATTREAAAIYAANGWPIFPLTGKDPATPHGFKDAAPEATPWHRDPWLNIGWAIPAGWWALDVDPRHGGDKSLRALEGEHGPLPLTLRAETGSGGDHWIFADPPGRKMRQLSGLRPGLDTRVGGKGYLVVAPSIHPATKRAYRWRATVAPVQAPAWLVDLVAEPVRAPRPVYVPPAEPDPEGLSRRQRYARGALRRLVQEVRTAPRGTRNDTLNRVWWRLAGFRDVLDVSEARDALTAAAFEADGGSTSDDRLRHEIAKVLR